MPDIKYVCLSDMHLGAQNSLLTNLEPNNQKSDTRVASPVLRGLIECLRELISQNQSGAKPTLLLGGDILELALTTDNQAAMAFERFIELIWPAPEAEQLFGEILYLPGNHDHHLWETARETQYVTYLREQKKPGEFLEIPWHATSMFTPRAVPSVFLNGIIHRYTHLAQKQIGTIYPNLGLLSADEHRCVVITHGHFMETMYLLMSTMRGLMFPDSPKPELTWDYESENFAWIDFFWSTMGRSGSVGPDVEIIYDKLQDQKQLLKLVSNLATGLARKPNRASWKNWLEARMLKKVLTLILFAASKAERNQPGNEALTPDTIKGMEAYLNGPVLKQIVVERNGNIPQDMSVVFGHTHKPFQVQRDFHQYQPGVNVYNTGGWVVDTVDLQSSHGGAVVLLDEQLNMTSLRMYNESADPSKYAVTVQTATPPNDEPNPLHERVSQLVEASKNPWKSFSETVAAEVPRRVENLKSKIKKW
jgi:UDP-2,3-diacylglucosamine pyrophosphatase LpxH